MNKYNFFFCRCAFPAMFVVYLTIDFMILGMFGIDIQGIAIYNVIATVL